MKPIQTISILLLLIAASIYNTALSQDSTAHTVTDPELQHYYSQHWFWAVVSFAVLIVLLYTGRRRKRKRLQGPSTL